MNKFHFIYTTLFILLFSNCGGNEPLDFTTIEEFEIYLEEEMNDQNIPALSVLIFEGETIKYEKYLGQSDVENNKALGQDDIFLLASVSKLVTATALLQLYEAGKLSLDDAINDYLPFDVSAPDQSTPITFRMLLTHTSAIADGEAAGLHYAYGEDSDLGLKAYMEKYLAPDGAYYDASDNYYNYAPGTKSNYSNMASALIGVLVAEIANQDFNAYCKDNIFQPLGMNNTYWSLEEALASNKTLVNPYDYIRGEFDLIQHYTFADYPNGALRSTARDMVKFLSALAQEGFSNNHQLLETNTVTEMLTPQIPDIDPSMGLMIYMLDESTNLWGHNGGEQGVATEVGFNPSNKIGAIVLANQGEVDVSELLIAAYLLGEQL